MTGAAEPVLAIEPAPLEVRRIVVLKLDHRGDFILATAAFEAVRSAFPNAHITVVCGPWNVAEAEGGGMFDRVLGLAFFPEFVHAENRVIGDAASLRAFARTSRTESSEESSMNNGELARRLEAARIFAQRLSGTLPLRRSSPLMDAWDAMKRWASSDSDISSEKSATAFPFSSAACSAKFAIRADLPMDGRAARMIRLPD